MPPGDDAPFHAAPVDGVVARVESDAASGLEADEAARRLERDGPNRLATDRRTSWGRLLAGQFADVLIGILVIAAAISGLVLDEWIDAGVILAIVLLNAVLGFVQEYRAEDALARLRELTVPVARVVRGGSEHEVAAETLAVGDIVLLEAGGRVPADARVLEAVGLSVDEALLTGESFPVDKAPEPVDPETELADRTSMVFMGTAVQGGRAKVMVTATGARTAMGDIAGMLAEEKDRATPLQADLARLGRRLGILAVVIAAALFLLGLLRNISTETLFLTVVALAVAAIPEGLPAVVTVTLATGVHRMAQRAAIVRRLPAVEALGAANVICTDKTGTLTRNEIRVQRVVFGSGERSVDDLDLDDPTTRRFIEIAVGCNDAHLTDGELRGESTDVALMRAARALGMDAEGLRRRIPRQREIGFSSDRQRMTTLHRDGDHYVLFVKGAPEVILDMACDVVAVETGHSGRPASGDGSGVVGGNDFHDRIHDLTRDGFRVLALAYRVVDPDTEDMSDLESLEHDLTVVGLAGMSDAIRDEVPDAVAEAQRAGITVVLVTGDHRETAEAVGRQTGILGDDQTSMTGRELEQISEEELAEHPERYAVYARVDPRRKVKILRGWQSPENVVAMTGDGVNDAPALQAADIGVAMGSGTDVAKDASAIILTDDNFATIVAAIREGRRIFSNVTNVVHFLLSANLAEIVVISVGLLALGSLGEPLLPTQILWINLITDGLPVLALAADPAAPDVMDRPPRRDRSFLGRRQQWRLGVDGTLLAGAALVTVLYGHVLQGYEWEHVRTLIFTSLVFVQFAQLVNIRAGDRSALAGRVGANRWLSVTIAASVVLQVLVIHVPIGRTLFDTVALTALDWTVVTALVGVALVALDAAKRLVGSITTPR